MIRPLVAGCLFLAAAVSAQAQEACSLIQITSSSEPLINLSPNIDAAGNRIVFVSNADLLGQNGDQSHEIFLWDNATGLRQITSNSRSFLDPTSNATATRIAFDAAVDLVGSNSDGSTEIFLWDAATGFTQITNGSSSELSIYPRINDAGARIAFLSSADLTGGNGDRNFEIFLWDASTGLAQITNTTGAHNGLPEINAEGNRIVFQSDANPLGSNGDGNGEIFLWDASAGLTQITHTTSGDSFHATINAAGNRIAFASRTNLVGGNGDGSDEIFLWDAATGFTQITNTPAGATNSSPSIDAAGNRVAFSNGFGIFLWDASSGVFPVMDSPGSSYAPSINAAGNRIAFSSTADPVGTNPDHNQEIFLATCGSLIAVEEAVPAVSPLGLSALAVLLGLAAAWTLRRRRA